MLGYLERILYGVAKAITEHISLGEAYYHVKKIYSISILYFDIGIGSDYLYYGQNNFIGVHTGDKLQVNVKEKNAIATRMIADITGLDIDEIANYRICEASILKI